MTISRAWFAILAIAVLLAAAAWAGLIPADVPFLVNTQTGADQRQPDVAYGGDGTALIVWDTDASGGEEIAGRVVTGDGEPVGTEFQINTTTANQQIRPAVAGFAGGGFVVVWESYELLTEEDQLFVQRLDAAGRRLGDEIRIDDAEFHLHADVATAGDGGFVVVWDDGYDVFGRLFDATGSAVGDDFFVNSQLGTMYGPRVSSDASGSFTVVWEDQSELDGDGGGVFLRRFDGDGQPLGDDVQVNSTTEGDQYAPVLATRPDGDFMVVWESYGQSGSGDGAFGRVFDASGSPVGGEFRVDGGTSVYAGYLDAAAVADGFAVVWNEPREAGGEVLTTLMRRFDGSGTGGEVIDVGGGDDDQANGAIAARGDDVTVTWEGPGPDPQDVFAQVFGTVGGPGCVGDCNGNGAVTINELILGVNISLGRTTVDRCEAVDRNGDGNVSISELITAVNASLEGC